MITCSRAIGCSYLTHGVQFFIYEAVRRWCVGGGRVVGEGVEII